MNKKIDLLSLVFIVLLLSIPAFGQTNLSVQELKEQYILYNKITNDPDIFWTLSNSEPDSDLYNGNDVDLNRGRFINRQRFEEIVMEKIMLKGKITLEERVAIMTYYINLSQNVKAKLRNKLLPDLIEIINKRENSSNQNINLNDNTVRYADDASSETQSFADVVAELSSDEYLNTVSYDSFIASSNGGGTAIQDSQTGSYDGNWNSATNDNYSSCPKTKPDERSSFKAYPNGQTSGNTYRYCVYFANGDLKREEPYVNGKLDGLKTTYIWSNKYNFSYTSSRDNYTNGKRNGLQETYLMAKNGAVYRFRLTTYINGIQHGDASQWHDNGQTSSDSNFFQGKITLQYNYRKDGTFTYCTKWLNDRHPRDCKTGKRR